MMTNYVYQALDKGRTFRLLKILPGQPDDQVRCTLQNHDLDDAPPFVALSYTWGTEEPTETIEVGGRSFAIRPNLLVALKQIRGPEEAFNIWIDAISIDQSNLQERSEQVRQMGDIYRNAIAVYVWLGEDEGYGEDALDFLVASSNEEQLSRRERIKDRIQGVFSMIFIKMCFYYVFSMFTGSMPLLAEQFATPEMSYGIAMFLRLILRRPWWERVWVKQEFLLARDVIFLCGTRMISKHEMAGKFELIGIMLTELDRYKYRTNVGITFMEEVLDIPEDADDALDDPLSHISTLYMASSAQKIMEGQDEEPEKSDGQEPQKEPSLSEWLEQTTKDKATDPRDKIFALLGLCDEETRAAIPVDYTKSVDEVNQTTALFLVQKEGFSFLHRVEPEMSDQFLVGHCPSWVPNLCQMVDDIQARTITCFASIVEGCEQYSVTRDLDFGGAKLHDIKSMDERSLSATGAMLDKVTVCSPFMLPVEESNSSLELLSKRISAWELFIAQHYPDRSTYKVNNSSIGQVFWRTLFRDRILKFQGRRVLFSRGIKAAWVAGLKVEVYAQFFLLAFIDDSCPVLRFGDRSDKYFKVPPRTDTDRSLVVSLLQDAGLEKKSLFITKEGYIGLGPQSTAKGDLVYLFPHVEVPFVVTRQDNGALRIKGQSYVHGIMDGELATREGKDFTKPVFQAVTIS